MATDYAEKEREFIGSLEADTGRALDAWMHEISAAALPGRNDIIDWLRHKGFTFANASWLERIHHNGGRLVYAGDKSQSDTTKAPVLSKATIPAPPPLPPASAECTEASGAIAIATHSEPPAVPALRIVVSNPASAAIPAATPAAAATGALSDNVMELLLTAKGLRPLAMLALQAIARVVPDVAYRVDGPLLTLSAPEPFLAVLPGAKSLRFYGSFVSVGDGRVARAEAQMKIPSNAAPPYLEVLVLTDARLVDGTFAQLVQAAHAHAHT